MARSAFKMKGWSGYQSSPMRQNEKEYTTSGKPEHLYDADGNKIQTSDLGEGGLSNIKTEKDTKRKYVVVTDAGEKSGEEGTRYYIKP